MFFPKHLKLFRKLLGTMIRPRIGGKNNIVKLVKVVYLLVAGLFELAGDTILWKNRSSSRGLASPSRILIVKTDQLGDLLFSTLLAPAIKAKYADARIDYLVRYGATQILKNNPHITKVYEWHNFLLELLPGRGKRKELTAWIRQNRMVSKALRANQYDLVINARAYPPSSNLLLRGFGKKLIAFDISELSFLADLWATYDLEGEEWQNYAKLLSPLGVDASAAAPCSEFYNCMARNPMQHAGAYVVLSPVSYEADRQWKDQYWTDLIYDFLSRGLNVALTGIPSQRKYLDRIAPPSNTEGVHIFADMHLQEFGALMKGAICFVGIDSFPAHLAISLRKPAALLVNPAVYYVPGLSSKKFAIEARCMISQSPLAALFDVKRATPGEIAEFHCDNKRQSVESSPSASGSAYFAHSK